MTVQISSPFRERVGRGFWVSASGQISKEFFRWKNSMAHYFIFGFHLVKAKKQKRFALTLRVFVTAWMPRRRSRQGTAAGNSLAPEKPKECI
jgi:hypothetical protein